MEITCTKDRIRGVEESAGDTTLQLGVTDLIDAGRRLRIRPQKRRDLIGPQFLDPDLVRVQSRISSLGISREPPTT